MASEANELQQLRARVGRLEAGAWVERGLLAFFLYLLWDDISGLAAAVGGLVLFLLVVFSIVERVRALR